MTRRPPESTAERLRASPNFALAFTQDGKPYVAKDSEPYIQYWLTERYRVLLSLFSARRGAASAEAIAAYCRLTGTAPSKSTNTALARAIANMRDGGVLIGARDDVSRYDAAMATHYVTYRPFPKQISDRIIADGGIGGDSRVLDLAGGPGDLALALARASRRVSLMELSAGFVKAARARARKLGLNLETLHESCNRLIYLDDAFDVITVSQALHWLDDVAVCRGVGQLLRPGGSFFVVHAAFDVPPTHPLHFLLGRQSVLGGKPAQPFAAEVQPLLRRLSLLFQALDAPDVDRANLGQAAVAANHGEVARIAPVSVSLFRQRRPMGLGFARAFLTPRHIETSGQSEDAFWRDLQARCAGSGAAEIEGRFNWALLQFRRTASAPKLPAVAKLPVTEIGYAGPPEI